MHCKYNELLHVIKDENGTICGLSRAYGSVYFEETTKRFFLDSIDFKYIDESFICDKCKILLKT
jgi:hypothetical protein